MEQFIGTKIINAKPMNRVTWCDTRGWNVPEDENGDDEGYLVEYTDGGKPNLDEYEGYVSWSPKEQFENAYRLTDGMNFGLASEAMLKGKKVAREGWNGKGMYAYYVPANSYAAVTDIAKAEWGDKLVPYRHYLALKTAQNDIATWSPSTSDALADDWMIV